MMIDFKIEKIINSIYSQAECAYIFEHLIKLETKYKNRGQNHKIGCTFTEKDIVLISYGDSIKSKNKKPLQALLAFIKKELPKITTIVHLLPFFPYSSDDGFSVIDYKKVDPLLGEWKDIHALAKNKKLMFDFVVNHISQESAWFESYLAQQENFKHMAIEVDPHSNLSSVIRPRTTPLLHEFQKKDGTNVFLWTTFSKDQIDLNFKDKNVIINMIDVLLFYVVHQASLIRLDAIAFLWKKLGSTCLHLPQTHKMIQLFRAILDYFAPQVKLITETNVPHTDNISYFGTSGENEADLVYNFALPPLLLNMFQTGDSKIFSHWAKQQLRPPCASKYFYHFTSSHDGIGLNGAREILTEDAIAQLVETVIENGGKINYKAMADGTHIPYEMNTSWVDAFVKDGLEIQKVLASYAIKLVLPGIPAFYINSLLGDSNWHEGFSITKHNRTLNRRKFDLDDAIDLLHNTQSQAYQIFSPLKQMISIRQQQRAFHPSAEFEVIDVDNKVFALLRWNNKETIFCLTNISNEVIDCSHQKIVRKDCLELLSKTIINPSKMTLNAYQSFWVKIP